MSCVNCGTALGFLPIANLLDPVMCLEPACRYQDPPSLFASRDANITALLRDGVPAMFIGSQFGISRQRVYQISEHRPTR
jgi:hypothetical protein